MKWVVPAAAGAGLVGAVGSYLVGRRVIDTHVTDYATHWGIRPGQLPEGVLHYVALGDSAAQGVGASRVGASYVAIIAARLAEQTGREVAVTNLSVSGAVSDDVVAHQLPQLADLPFTPDIITMDIGANDVVFPGHDTDTFTRSMRVILEALPRGSFVADVPWFMIPGLDKQSRNMAAAAAALVRLSGHHLVAIHEASRAVGRLAYLRYTAQDLFHPNDKGYASWAQAFWDAIVASGRLDDLAQIPPAEDAPASP
ncbi:SGNH/GDSL hydrolase family protein [Tessaracoccus antarcticus]|uniref:SGNH/GDSL hydrolase family protein n=1 Tax=Tessaracoccus antarcticus TaxID=2479848 RepID=A0A3M0GI84_9ACTN|nr:SGNH/GDSL hydrolase family protein [Tessaracoccus antarcticus]RMB61323.1 SGNH/GDSL hydrolase family protein [Tessaracoccus antarcticus]